MISENILKVLKEQLPLGYAKLIQLRLSEKGYSFSVSYIHRILNPVDHRENKIILAEAIELSIEFKKEQALLSSEMEDQILNPEL